MRLHRVGESTVARPNGANARHGYVYLLEDGTAYKIGITKNSPFDRLSDLQTGNPRRISVFDAVWVSDKWFVEGMLHCLLNEFQTEAGNEWFYLSWDDVEFIVKLFDEFRDALIEVEMPKELIR